MWSNNDRNALVFPPGATSGARIIIGFDPTQGASGIFAYNAAGDLVFSLTTSTTASIGFTPIPFAAGQRGNIYWQTGFTGEAAVYGIGTPSDSLILQGNWEPAFSKNPFIQIGPGDSTRTPFVAFECTPPYFVQFGFGTRGVAVVPDNTSTDVTTFRFGPGSNGGYYYEEWNLAAQAIPAATTTDLRAMVLAYSETDYATAMDTTTGLWTAPASGVYTITMAIGATTWTAGDHYRIEVADNVSGRSYGTFDQQWVSNVNMPPMTYSITRSFGAGTVLKFRFFTTAARTVSTSATATSYLGISRKL